MATKKKTVKKKTVKKKGATKGCGIKNGCKSKKGGLTAKGRKMINKKTGSNLKAPQPGGGPRKRSFCARFKGMKGPMKKPNGKPTRKALAMKRWKC
tara:strand:+ start:744 stop:1031 length:288 start_codon:yes stop_codon:yes gene_type:complete